MNKKGIILELGKLSNDKYYIGLDIYNKEITNIPLKSWTQLRDSEKIKVLKLIAGNLEKCEIKKDSKRIRFECFGIEKKEGEIKKLIEKIDDKGLRKFFEWRVREIITKYQH